MRFVGSWARGWRPGLLVAGLLAMAPLCHSHVQNSPRKGDVVFRADFEGPDALRGWNGSLRLERGYSSSQSLSVHRSEGSAAGSAMAWIPIRVERLRGCRLMFTGMVRAENVSQKPQPWNGVKFMAAIVAESGRQWPQAELGVGTFEWQRVSFPVYIPRDATEMTLYLGLEAVSGKAWFDDIQVKVQRPPVPVRSRSNSGRVYKGHTLPRLRGVMVDPDISAESLRVLGTEWNANLIRWQLVRRGTQNAAEPLDLEAYDRWLEGELRKLDAALPLCEKYGLKVVVDLHSPPGGRVTSGGYAGSDAGLFNNAACQAKFVENWQRIARRYRNSRAVWGYDLANEPVEGTVEEDLADWQELAEKAARAICSVDRQHAIIVEPAPWGSPAGLEQLQPLDLPNVVYSVHMYLPSAFTHQGVYDDGTRQYRYPGFIEGKQWDRAALDAALKPVVEFQQRYGVHIYIGEFSAIRWAPDNSAYRYLKDLIEIFEEHGWDWSYHAFREWSGWSVEHSEDRNDTKPSPTPTDRKRLLLEWFAKNKKPK